MRAALAALTTIVVVLTWAVAGASAQGTLGGEEFLDFSFQKCVKFDADGEAECFGSDAKPENATATCDRDGTSTVSFTVSGVATGPYPGTFEEHVTLQIGPQTRPAVPQTSLYDFGTIGFTQGQITSYRAEFTVFDADGDAIVTGTKQLAPGETGSYAVCRRYDNEMADNPAFQAGGPITGYFTIARAPALVYSASIHADGERPSRDSGTSDSTYAETFAYNEQRVCSVCNPNDRVRSVGGGFGERFYSTPADRPGLGCGDRNHTHEREAQCRKQLRADRIAADG
jgi:hypothetical protein